MSYQYVGMADAPVAALAGPSGGPCRFPQRPPTTRRFRPTTSNAPVVPNVGAARALLNLLSSGLLHCVANSLVELGERGKVVKSLALDRRDLGVVLVGAAGSLVELTRSQQVAV